MNKKELKEKLDWHFLNVTGYRKINGGYAEVTIEKLTKLPGGFYHVKGELESGEQNMGDGHSVKYTDELEELFVDGEYKLYRTEDVIEKLSEKDKEKFEETMENNL